jgi:hypothetical protein
MKRVDLVRAIGELGCQLAGTLIANTVGSSFVREFKKRRSRR